MTSGLSQRAQVNIHRPALLLGNPQRRNRKNFDEFFHLEAAYWIGIQLSTRENESEIVSGVPARSGFADAGCREGLLAIQPPNESAHRNASHAESEQSKDTHSPQFIRAGRISKEAPLPRHRQKYRSLPRLRDRPHPSFKTWRPRHASEHAVADPSGSQGKRSSGVVRGRSNGSYSFPQDSLLRSWLQGGSLKAGLRSPAPALAKIL